MARKIILDCNPGNNDALVLLMAGGGLEKPSAIGEDGGGQV